MTAKELIHELQQLPGITEVFVDDAPIGALEIIETYDGPGVIIWPKVDADRS